VPRFQFQIYDLFILLLLLVICYGIGVFIYYKNRKKKPFYKYFLPGLTVKFIGGISFAFIYVYYFLAGDTLGYFMDAQGLMDVFSHRPDLLLDIMATPAMETGTEASFHLSHLYYYNIADSSWNMVKISTMLIYLGLNNYYGVTVICAFLSFLGIWKLFLTFRELYPNIERKMAIATLFVPSVFFWGSGLLKDTIVIGALGVLVYGLYSFYKNPFNLKAILNLLLGFVLLLLVKKYVLAAILPSALLWYVFAHKEKIKNNMLKIFLWPFFLIASIGLVIGLVITLNQYFEEYNVEDALGRAKVIQVNHYSADGSVEGTGSGYSLGDYEQSAAGVLKVIPAAINVTLFRPYLWEIKNPVMLLAAIESFSILIFTLYLMFVKINFFKALKLIINQPFLFLCLSFSLLFAFSVGFTSYNFGALVRYKIPCIPFFLGFLFMLEHEISKKKITVK
jgi:hypothetical protein